MIFKKKFNIAYYITSFAHLLYIVMTFFILLFINFNIPIIHITYYSNFREPINY